ncbi:hypothetical protein EXS65_03040 [Candidatus Peribacteria bacterium]|nr:hypothetical protein [Candidatus Peribacteria bacterium]
MNSNNDPNDNELFEQYPQQKEGLREILSQIAIQSSADQVSLRKALARYMQEALGKSYQTEPDGIVDLIRERDLFRDSDALVDLGAGPGDLLERLAPLYPAMRMRGIDLSPGFVTDFNRRNIYPNTRMDVGLIDTPLSGIDSNNRTSAMSVLTLDRLAQPRIVLENMAQFTRAKILATLLPIIPEDDNPSR